MYCSCDKEKKVNNPVMQFPTIVLESILHIFLRFSDKRLSDSAVSTNELMS